MYRVPERDDQCWHSAEPDEHAVDQSQQRTGEDPGEDHGQDGKSGVDEQPSGEVRREPEHGADGQVDVAGDDDDGLPRLRAAAGSTGVSSRSRQLLELNRKLGLLIVAAAMTSTSTSRIEASRDRTTRVEGSATR